MADENGSGAFVGRSAELEVLRRLVTGVAAGRGGVAWVEGEPGIGKSALVGQALAGAAELGCAVFWGAADQLRERFPLGVMLDCLSGGSGPPEREMREISALLRGEGAQAAVPAGDAVVAAAERVLALADRLCAASPVVLVIDDLQWADEMSVAVWHRLAGGTGQVPLLVVGTCRPVPRRAELVVARDGVARIGGLVMALGPLPAPEVAVLVGYLAGGRPGPGLLARADRAGGNPLYLRELTDALARAGQVEVSGGVAEVTEGGEGGTGLVSLAAAIEGRLGFLSAGALRVLRTAALLGGRFSVRDLRIVAGGSAMDLAAVVGEAVAAGVLVESGQDLVFRHGLIQQALAEGMPAGLREELHREAARALAEAGAGAERVAAQLLAAGGELDGWMADWLAVNAAALVHRAPPAAAELLERALAGMPAGGERGEVLAEHLAWVLYLLARFERAQAVARGLLAGTRDPERRARMAWILVSMLSRTQRPAEGLAVADQALAEPDVPGVWRARLRSVRAMVLSGASRLAEADREAADALAEAERIGDRFAAGFGLHVRSVVRLDTGDMAGGLELTERGLAVIGDDQEAADVRLLLSLNRMSALANLDRVSGAELDQVLTLAERNGTARAATARLMVAEVMFELGRWDDALAEIDALLQPGGDAERPIEVSLRGLAALIAAHRDDQASVAAHLRAADHLPPDHSGLWRLIGVHGLQAKAMAAERDGRAGEAAALLETALSADFFCDPEKLSALADLARCALAVGDGPAAEAAAASGERQADQYDGGVAAAAAKRCRGLVDGDPGPLREAVAYYRSAPRPLGLGQALEDLAVVLAAGGDPAAARAALGEAAELYAGLDAQWDVLRADARLRPLGVRRRRPGSRRPQVGWAALTPTEEKVAYLVAEGLSNPEIGARLFLSRYTVQVHVSRILAKLGVRSRVEVAREVAQRPEAAARSAG